MSIASVRLPAASGLKRLARLLQWLLASLGLLLVVVTLTPVVSWWGRALAGPWNDPTGETLVVLAGSAREDGIIGESSYLRSAYAVAAYRQGGFREIVISGGGYPGSTPAAAAMKAFLVSQGVPAAAIRAETQSRSTRENAVYTSKMLGGSGGGKVLLTSDYHMFRAYRVFRKLGIQVLPRPVPDAVKRGASFRRRWPAFLDLAIETCKIAYYYARGWI